MRVSIGPGRVTIRPRQISRLFGPGGQAHDWLGRESRKATTRASLTAPQRTGRLALAHDLTVRRTGPYGTRATISNGADHASFVHGGTANNRTGFIYPRRGEWLRLRAGGGYSSGYARRVRGQRANPWLRRAVGAVFSTHGIRIT